MCRITTTELKNNYGMYVELAQKERIEVTKRGLVIFTMVPKNEEYVDKLKSYFGFLPSNASIGVDPDERG